MIKGEENNPVSVKVLDFQFIKYTSVAVDLLFFLITSVQYELLDKSFDQFLCYYYEELLKALKIHKCVVDGLSYNT